MDSRPILDGIRVVDMTQYLAGPAATRLLAEMGADIVKIERPPHGDPSREYPVVNDGRSGYFVQQNRGKKSLCLDFEQARGREVLDALLARADVFVENFGPGVLERRGLDWASLHARHPRLVMASISGYGRDGAYSHRTAFDLIAQAQSGIMHLTGSPDGPPMPVGTSIGDVGAGVHAATGIGYALFHRERTGQGQHVDISMVDALFHMHELAVQGPALTGFRWRPERPGHQSNVNAPQGAYQAPEGWIVVHAMARQWPSLCKAMGRPELAEDERFDSLTGRQKNRDELNRLIAAWMAGFESDDQVIAALDAERVPCAKVMEPRDAIGHPHFESRGMIRRSADPILDEVIVPGSPLKFSEQTEPLELQAPLLGEHNAAVLTELGYDAEKITELTRAGILLNANR
jgi:CoA:oxalate CoA-transferase